MTYLENLFSLAGRRALVTGGGRGNGCAMAEALGRAGAELLLVDRDGVALSRTVETLNGQGLEALSYSCDLGDLGAIEQLVGTLRSEVSGLDVLVNNAGVTVPGELASYTVENWEATLAVNLRAPFLLVRGLLPLLERGTGPSVINVTSLNAELAFPDNPAYAASKGGLRQLTRAMALDLGPRGIRVNAVGPGYIRTAMTEGSWMDPGLREERSARTILGRWGQPSDLAGAVLYLASKASAYVTGITIYVDGGWLAKGL